MNIKEFLYRNRLKQVELANYLGITEGSVSRMCSGACSPSAENLNKILHNDKGWDVSMLTPGTVSGVIISGRQNKVGDIDNRQYYSDSPDVLKAQIQLLENSIKEKDAQIKEKDAQIKEKDAQINKLLEILSTSRI